MNILMWIVLIIALGSILSGYKDGFLKTMLSLVAWLIVLIACKVATPMVADFLIQNTEIETRIQSVLDVKIDEIIKEAMEEAGLSEIQDVVPEDFEEFEVPEELQAALPEELRDLLLNAGDEKEVKFIDTAAVAEEAVEIISLLIVLIFTWVTLLVLNFTLGIASMLPFIGPLDKILGLVCGFGKAIIFTWMLLAVISLLTLTGIDTQWAGYILESEILTWLQNNNVILNLIAN